MIEEEQEAPRKRGTKPGTWVRPEWDPDKMCHGHLKRVECSIYPPRDCQNTEHKCTRPAGAMTAHRGFGFCRFHGGNTPIMAMSAEKAMRIAKEMEALVGLSLSMIGDRLARAAAAQAMAYRDSPDEFAKYVRAFAAAAERAEGSTLTIEGRVGVLAEASDEELAAVYRRLTDMVEEARKAPPMKLVGPGAPARSN